MPHPISPSRIKTAAIAAALMLSSTATHVSAKTTAPTDAQAPSAVTERLVIKLKSPDSTGSTQPSAASPTSRIQAQANAAARAHTNKASALSRASGARSLTFKRATTAGYGIYQVTGGSKTEIDQAILRLRAHPDVALVERDIPIKAKSIAGLWNDPLASIQWWLPQINALDLHRQGITGAGVGVAVIDSGYVPHFDLPAALQGFDFVSDPSGLGDGDGRDNSALDPGDYCIDPQTSEPSSWHGTNVAGVINAVGNNSRDMVGAAPAANVHHIRALGQCGGFLSDVADAIAAMPTILPQVKVINMSLGGETPTCPSYMQDSINIASAAGLVMVASAGNEGPGTINAPANCTGVISVSAATPSRDVTDYSSTNAFVTVAAPSGGRCANQAQTCVGNNSFSTDNSGMTAPQADEIDIFAGTSFAAPLVASTAALMLQARPNLTPSEVRSILMSTSTPFASDSLCRQPGHVNTCGAGIINAKAAVEEALRGSGQASVQVTSRVVGRTNNTGASVTASGVGASDYTYAWQQVSGVPVTITPGPNGTARVVSSQGLSGTAFLEVTASSATIAGQATEQVVVQFDDPPSVTLTPTSSSYAPGDTVRIAVAINDDVGTPTYALVNPPAGARLEAPEESSELYIVLDNAPQGLFTFTIMVEDAEGQTATASRSVQVGVTTSSSAGGGGGGALSTAWGAGLFALLGLNVALNRIGRKKDTERASL